MFHSLKLHKHVKLERKKTTFIHSFVLKALDKNLQISVKTSEKKKSLIK